MRRRRLGTTEISTSRLGAARVPLLTYWSSRLQRNGRRPAPGNRALAGALLSGVVLLLLLPSVTSAAVFASSAELVSLGIAGGPADQPSSGIRNGRELQGVWG